VTGFLGCPERGTTLRTEVLAGITTFMTMASITFVSPVTTPALIVVGSLRLEAVRFIPRRDFDEAILAFLTILTLPLAFSISYGIGFGIISYVVIKLGRGKPGETRPLLYGVAVLFALAFVLPALQNHLCG
jgi:adenine/guanine/hypoxanthine permease